MKVLVVNRKEVTQLLPMGECIDAMAEAFRALSSGNTINPLRPVLWLPGNVGALGMMPAYVGDIKTMGLKVVSVFPGNLNTEYDSHMGAVLIFETEHGQLLAIIDAGEITALRTAAVSGLATKLLARQTAHDLTILGSGIQAWSHLESMLLVRPIRRVRVWSRNPDHAGKFAERGTLRHKMKVEPISTVKDAVVGADLICSTTAAPEPILLGAWISPGTHINAVGSSVAFTRELDTAAMVKSRLFVDRRESTLNEAGDFLIPKKEGVINEDHIRGEIGEILIGRVEGRKSEDEITLFKSLGLAVEDVAAAHHIYKMALEKGIGTYVELGGERPFTF